MNEMKLTEEQLDLEYKNAYDEFDNKITFCRLMLNDLVEKMMNEQDDFKHHFYSQLSDKVLEILENLYIERHNWMHPQVLAIFEREYELNKDFDGD